MRFPIIGKTVAELNAIGKPNGAKSEAIPYVIYDTQTWPAAGLAGQLQFYLTQQADQTLGNLQTAGLLPQPQWFEIHCMYADFLGTPTIETAGAAATTLAGQMQNIELVLKAARATFELNIAQKSYGVFPLTFLHASGGAVGFTAGVNTAATGMSQANNGIQGTGWAPNGSIVIPPTQGFNVTLRAQPTLVPISVATLIRVSLVGVLHRAVR